MGVEKIREVFTRKDRICCANPKTNEEWDFEIWKLSTGLYLLKLDEGLFKKFPPWYPKFKRPNTIPIVILWRLF